MARVATGDKPQDIRQATVDEVAAVGSSAVSVNKIARRAGVAVGTIYRFHATKDALLGAVYLQVKSDLHDAMMRDADRFQTTADRLRAMWFAIVDYGYNAPNDFRFAEIMSADVKNEVHNDPRLRGLHADILSEIETGIADGTLADVSVRSIEVVLASTAGSLARRASYAGVAPNDALLADVYALVWQGIAQQHPSG